VEGGPVEYVVVAERERGVELLAGEYQTLLVDRDPLLVADLRHDALDRLGRVYSKQDLLARERLHENGARRVAAQLRLGMDVRQERLA
jgi:hypothetical protein